MADYPSIKLTREMKVTLKAEAEDVKSKNGTIENANPEANGLYRWVRRSEDEEDKGGAKRNQIRIVKRAQVHSGQREMLRASTCTKGSWEA